MAESRPCPGCRRPNPAHKERCLYCGAVLPDPAPAPAAPVSRELSAEQEAELMKALRLGNPLAARRALGAAARAPEVERASPSAVDAAPPPPPASAAELIARAREALEQAAADLEAAEPALDAAAAAIAQARARLPRPPPPPAAPALPSWRLPYAWVAMEEDPGRLTAAGLDLPTARLAARAGYPRLLARSADREGLLARGLGRVLEREELLAVGHARLLIERWRVAEGPAWLRDDLEGVRGDEIEAPRVTLAVPAEVVLRRSRVQKRGKEEERVPGMERRLQVLDLHGPGLFLRVIEGVSRLGQPSSVAFKRLPEELGARVVTRRVLEPAEGAEDSWPQMEEHSRFCRLLLLEET